MEPDEKQVNGTPGIMAWEVLIYVGVAALIASLASVLESVPQGGRGVILAALAIAVGAAGAALLRDGNGPLARAAGVLWIISVAFAAEAGGSLSGRGFRGAGRPLLASGIPSFSLAFVYYAIRRSGTQLVAAFGSGLLVVFGLANGAVSLTTTSGGLLLSAVGTVGLAATARSWIAPVDAANQLFGAAFTIGFFVPALAGGTATAELAAIGSAGIVLWLALRRRSTALLLVGSLSLSIFTMVDVERHFAGRLGVPTALLVVGAFLIGGGVLRARLGPIARNGR